MDFIMKWKQAKYSVEGSGC